MTRADLVAAARESIAKGSKSFAAASTLFAPDVRERAWLLYAWCRHCDDVIDDQMLGEGAHEWGDWGATPAERLARLRDAGATSVTCSVGASSAAHYCDQLAALRRVAEGFEENA